MPTKSTRLNGAVLGIQCASRGRQLQRGNDQRVLEAVSESRAVNGCPCGHNDSSPEDAGSRY